MAILPGSRSERLEYIESKVPIWTAASSQIGLSAPQLVLLSTQTSACRAAYQAMISAQQASKNATQAFYNTCATMTDTAADYLKVIKAYAASTNNPGVYTIASIPPNKTPSAPVAPPTPANVTATLLNSGGVRLDWKASIGDGVVFTVWRKLATEANIQQIGLASGAKFFEDNTLPVGTQSSTGVVYQVKATRLGLESDFSEPVLVKFGAIASEASPDGDETLRIAA